MKKSWIKYFFDICDTVARKSKDPTTKVGAVIVGSQNQVLGTAFNGLPMGVPDFVEGTSDRYEKPQKYIYTVHAEANIIALAARHGVRLDGSILFCNLQPCVECTKLIIQAGIKEVYCRVDEGTGDWRELLVFAKIMCKESGVKIFAFDELGGFQIEAGTGDELYSCDNI